MLTGLRRIVRAGFVGFWRNAFISFTSIIVMVVALFVIASTLFNTHSLESALNDFQDRVDINLYFVPDASVDEIDRIRSSVAALPDVAAVTYTSREDALEEYRARNQDNEIALQALEELNENPLGATIAIQAKETSQYEAVAQYLDEQKAQEEVGAPVIDVINFNRNKDSIDTLTAIINAVERSSFVILVVLLIAATLITFNTIRLAIYTSREEIAIMRLVGASNMFIRGPFMLQGIMYGFLAGLLTLALFYPILIWIGPETAAFFEVNLFDYYLENFRMIFGVIVGIGVVLGLISSTLAIARYLRT
jgi:cell division transport system permease protein